ncbi:hypothetical protein JXA32_09345 [Candidatus Sumerlaeota bacterium]|nr:hypothetical protein [Candidatus Sumerlaeota bacterium]
MNNSSFDKWVNNNAAFDGLREAAYRGDAESHRKADDFARKCRVEGLPGELDGLHVWKSAKKLLDRAVEMIAPFPLMAYQPASLGAASALTASTTKYIPEIGGYLRIELTADDEGAVRMTLWLEDHEGARPAEEFSLAGELEPEGRSIAAVADSQGAITVKLRPEANHTLLFDLALAGETIAEGLQLSLS